MTRKKNFTKTKIGMLWSGDCFDAMATLADDSVDCVLCDLPYGTTACKWDTVLDLDRLWAEWGRICKKNAPIILTASQPFTSRLVMSKPKWFKCEWIWDKKTISNPMQAKYQPLRQHETILVFSAGGGKTAYFPIKTDLDLVRKWTQARQNEDAAIPAKAGRTGTVRGKYPKTIISIAAAKFEGRTVHPTQKPVALFEYLVKTYTKEGQTILDCCAGSGTTGVAATRLGRKALLCELEPKYQEVIRKRKS